MSGWVRFALDGDQIADTHHFGFGPIAEVARDQISGIDSLGRHGQHRR